MTEEQLKEIQKRANAASPGPWFDHYNKIWSQPECERLPDDANPVAWTDASHGDTPDRPDDTQFIAHAREDIPALIGEVRKLKALLKKLEFRGDHSEMTKCCPDCVGYPKHQNDCELAEALK